MKVGLKGKVASKERNLNDLFQTKDELRGCTKAQFKIKTHFWIVIYIVTLLESKNENISLKMSTIGPI